MAGKRSAKNTLKESISLSVKAQQYFGYSDYFNRIPLFTMLQVSNSGAESAEDIDVVIECSGGFLLPFTKHLGEIPFESSVEVAAENIVSPLYLTEVSELTVVTVKVFVRRGKDILAEESVEVAVLPFDFWCGRSGNAELLASFVRPKVADCLRVLQEAHDQLAKWNIPCEWQGYQGICDGGRQRKHISGGECCRKHRGGNLPSSDR